MTREVNMTINCLSLDYFQTGKYGYFHPVKHKREYNSREERAGHHQSR